MKQQTLFSEQNKEQTLAIWYHLGEPYPAYGILNRPESKH
jgi:hypothetical protein